MPNTVLTPEQESAILRDKVRSLESDRGQTLLEIEALNTLDNLNEQEQAELRSLKRAAERLDARIDVHTARLDELGV